MQFVMLNLFTMVITEAFEILRDRRRSTLHFRVPDFKAAWVQYDPDATGAISRDQLALFIKLAPSPWGTQNVVGKGDGHAKAAGIAQLLLSQPGFAERAHFTDTLIALAALYLAQDAGSKVAVPAGYEPHILEVILARQAITRPI